MTLFRRYFSHWFAEIVVTIGGLAVAMFLMSKIVDGIKAEWTPWVYIIVIFAAMLLGMYIVFRTLIPRRLTYEKIFSELTDVKKSLAETKPTQLAEAIDKKKEGFINIGTISFHFANKDEVRNFYNDYFKEPTVEQIVSEMASEVSGDIKGQLPRVFEAKAGGKDLNKWISTIKLPGISEAEMFRRYQREIVRNDQVTLGLELVEVDLSDLNAFDKLVSEFQSKYSGILDDSKVEEQQTRLREKAAEKTMIRLENATGWVLVEGKFEISELSEGSYKCTYEHPVNEYFAEKGSKITISMSLRKNLLEANIADNYAQSVGRSIPLKIYGKVFQPIDRKTSIWELQITPTAVY